MEWMVPLDTHGGQPMYEQIYEYLKNEIRRGNLAAGARLPSTRALAENLKISRSTTQMAYEQLVAEGYIETAPCRGYFVLKELPPELISGPSFGGAGVGISGAVSARLGGEASAGVSGAASAVRAERETEIRGGERPGQGTAGQPDVTRKTGSLCAGTPEPAVIDFSPRGIDLGHFPYNAWRKVTRETLVDDNREMFLTGSPQGEPEFREAIRGYLHSARGVECSADQIVIGAGSEYLLMLLSLVLGRDRRIAMENPTYRQAYRVLKSLGYPVAPVEMDRHGMNVRLLEQSGADVAYIMPSHQYPLGIVMPVRRRQELLSWAVSGKDRYLIEDDYDSEFRYKGKPIPALQGMDRNGRVIYIGTFSKSIAPAIRVGYMVLPWQLLDAYQAQFRFYASTVSRIDQRILCQFLTEGYYERHLNRMRAIYRGKHDVLLGALKRLEDCFEIQGEYAGLHVLLTDRRGRSETWLAEQARAAGVAVYGLSSCLIGGGSGRYRSTVMLGYANVSAEEIVRGADRLWEAWCREGD